MPRVRKLPGQAVDSRNGQQSVLPAAVPVPRIPAPRRPDGNPLERHTRAVWKAYWDDERLPSLLLPADRDMVIRWGLAVDDAVKAHALAWTSPLASGSMGQQVKSPYFEIRAMALAELAECERQLGIGPLNRSKLGYTILAEQKQLQDLSADFPGGDSDEPDPRLG